MVQCKYMMNSWKRCESTSPDESGYCGVHRKKANFDIGRAFREANKIQSDNRTRKRRDGI